MPQHSNKEQAHMIKEGKCFSCKEKHHTAYNCLRKGKIVAISESISKDSDGQRKE